MKVLALFYLLSNSSILHSKEIDRGIFRVLQDLNQKQNVNYSQQSCSSSLPTKQSSIQKSEEYNECALALCGEPKNNPSAWVTDENFSSSISDELRANINNLNPQFNKIYLIAQEKNLKKLNVYRKIFLKNSFSPEILDTNSLRMFNQIIVDSIFTVNSDQNKNIQDRIHIQINIPKWASSNDNIALNELARIQKEDIYSDFNQMSKYFSDDEIYSILNSHYQTAIDIFKNNQDKFSLKQMDDYKRTLSAIESSLKNANGDKNGLAQVFNLLEALNNDFNLAHPKLKQIFPKPVCNSKNCIEFYKNSLAQMNLEKIFDKIEERLKDPIALKKSINSCKAALIASSLKNSNFFKTWNIFRKVKMQMEKNVLTKFSKHSQIFLRDYLNNRLDYSRENTKKLITSVDPISDFKFKADMYVKGSTEPFISNLAHSLTEIKKMAENINSLDPFLDEASPCGNGPGSNAWDAFLPTLPDNLSIPDSLKKFSNTDHIFISDFTCNHEHRGKHAVAHEIGHALSSVFRSQKTSQESLKKYLVLRACATNKYFDFRLATTFNAFENDQLYIEEDTADLIAFMSYPNDKTLFTCSLLKPSLFNEQYSDLYFILENNDPHSTPFTRVINEAIQKNVDLPVSCSRLIQNENPRMSFTPCLK